MLKPFLHLLRVVTAYAEWAGVDLGKPVVYLPRPTMIRLGGILLAETEGTDAKLETALDDEALEFEYGGFEFRVKAE